MIRRIAVAWLVLAAGVPLSAAEPAKSAPPAVRPFTTAQLASWLCRGLPGNDGRKVKATLFDGKVPGEADEESWSALVMEDGQDRIDVNFMGMKLLDDVGAWVLTIELEGDWHGISEEDWVALARKIPGRTEKGDHRGIKICAPEKKGSCTHRGGYEPGRGFAGSNWSGGARTRIPRPGSARNPETRPRASGTTLATRG